MKKIFLSGIWLLGAAILFAQPGTADASFREQAIKRMVILINDNYVFPDVAKATGDHLIKKMNEGRFDADTTVEKFARSLTEEVQSINHDKHMRIRPSGSGPVPGGPGNAPADAGFREVKLLEGNIGYIDLRLFHPPSLASGAADGHMKTLQEAKAIIIDLRQNGGGSPEMVQYLCSYFFDRKVHLNSLYNRLTNSTREFWTREVEGKPRPDVPLYVLTSKRTFSAAEEFSYNMQTQKRAILIGETTGGGANPGGMFRINEQLGIFIPTGRAINPITKTNWEGTGVKPDIAVPAESALTEALRLVNTGNGK